MISSNAGGSFSKVECVLVGEQSATLLLEAYKVFSFDGETFLTGMALSSMVRSNPFMSNLESIDVA